MGQKCFFAAPSGLTLTAKLIDDSSGLPGYDFTAQTVAEAPAGSGLYAATFDPSGLITGTYRIVGLRNNVGVCHYLADFTGTANELVRANEFTEQISADAIRSAVWDATTNQYQLPGSTGESLKDAAAGGGGGVQPPVVVYPVISQSPQRTNMTTLKAYIDETAEFDIAPIDASGNAVNPSGMTLKVVIEDRMTNDIETIDDAAITKTATSYSFKTVTSNTTLGQKTWSCRIVNDGNQVLSTGNYITTEAPN